MPRTGLPKKYPQPAQHRKDLADNLSARCTTCGGRLWFGSSVDGAALEGCDSCCTTMRTPARGARRHDQQPDVLDEDA